VSKILYITYDGLTDPLGRSQILPYLRGCSKLGHRITVLSCEKPAAFARSGAEVQALCDSSNIGWRPLRYHRWPPVFSSLLDTAMLTRAAAALHREHRFQLVHCRSYLPAITGLRLKQSAHVPLLFDMRGFWPEEKVEGGSWDLSRPLHRSVYRYFKALESDLLRTSDHIITLTEAAKDQLLSRTECRGRQLEISVIPCCVDFAHFRLAERMRRQARTELGIAPAAPVLGYLGSLGGNYMLNEMLEFFACFARLNSGAIFLLVTVEDPDSIRKAARARGIDDDLLVIRAAGRDEVPRMIAAADAGIAFKSASFSSLACSPTKLGEMLAMGIPVVANSGVGDVEALLTASRSGIVVNEFSEGSYRNAVDKLKSLSISAEEVRDRARKALDLENAVKRYSEIYDALGGGPASK
jgi:glycosyltransferase involved in cell wall biosynthesis